MYSMKNIFYILLACIVFIYGCKSDTPEISYAPTSISLEAPSNFPELKYELSNNPITQEGFDLGKALFYEGRLSSNNAIPCAFCHEQAFAFTHHGHTLSHGVNGGIGFRNSPPIQNLGYFSDFMWDGAASHLDLQPIIPITSELEMDETLSNIELKLKEDAYYQKQFQLAFEDGAISSENILKALSQFMLMMVSSNSKYDKYIRNEDGVTLTDIELRGQTIFQNKCTSCHATDLFTDQSYRNTGLPVNPVLNDKGRYNVLENEADLYKFKVPSLRNIEKTFPYMHDGRFSTLAAVLNFYDEGMVENGGVVDESLLREDGSFGIPLTEVEKTELIAFLLTLTDDEFLNDTRFAEF